MFQSNRYCKRFASIDDGRQNTRLLTSSQLYRVSSSRMIQLSDSIKSADADQTTFFPCYGSQSSAPINARIIQNRWPASISHCNTSSSRNVQIVSCIDSLSLNRILIIRAIPISVIWFNYRWSLHVDNLTPVIDQRRHTTRKLFPHLICPSRTWSRSV